MTTETCIIYDPNNNYPKFTPKMRPGWRPLSPVYRKKQEYRHGFTWHYLFECVHCGVGVIGSLGDSTLHVCECQRKRIVVNPFVDVVCDNCGKLFEITTQQKANRFRKYCSETCKKEYRKNLTPTAEWLALSGKPRDYRLKDIMSPGKYDIGGRNAQV